MLKGVQFGYFFPRAAASQFVAICSSDIYFNLLLRLSVDILLLEVEWSATKGAIVNQCIAEAIGLAVLLSEGNVRMKFQ